MDLIRFAINRPVTISVAVILIVLFGLISLGMIPIQMTPDIEQTVVSVQTRWEGASPDEVEKDIIIEQEKFLRSVTGLRKIMSTARLGQGEITLEFDQGITREVALREVSDKLREVPSYPQNVDEPVVRATNPADRDYITWVIIRVTDPDYDVRFLQDFFDDRVKPELERVPGVGDVNVLGGYEREVHVSVDPNRMAQHSISPTRFVHALQTQNRDASAGELIEGKLDIRVRSVGRYEALEQIRDTVVSEAGEPIVRVKDVAEASIGFKKPLRTVRNKGRVVLAMNAQREIGSNVIEVMDAFRDRLDWVQRSLLPAEAERLGIDGEIVMEQAYDQTEYINDAVKLVQQNIVFGGTIAVIVLLLFLRSVRATSIIALAIPTSVIGTFVVMAAMGRSLNVISLAGLAFAVGLVVDNAIVVLENIDRHIRLGEKPAVAAYKATREVWGAILASTLTTLSVFIPILLIEEEAGQLFRDIAIAICAAVSLSLIVAITVIPSAGSRWLRPVKRIEDASVPLEGEAAPPANFAGRVRRDVGRVLRTIPRLPAMFVWGIGAMIDRIAQTWVLRVGIIAIMTAAAILGAWALVPDAHYLPQGNRNLVFGMVNTPPAYNLPQKEAIGENIERYVEPFWRLHDEQGPGHTLPLETENGEIDVPGLGHFFFVATPEMMFMGGRSDDDRNVQPVQAMLNHALAQQPAITGFATQMPLFRTSGRGSGNALELEITGADLDEVSTVAIRLRDDLRQQFGFGAVQASPTNFDLPGPEVRVTRDDVRAGDVGLLQDDVNLAVQIFGDGAIIGDFVFEGETIDLKVRPNSADSGDATALADYSIATPVGRAVPLSSVATIERTLAPQEIQRVRQQRAVTVSINLPEDIPLEAAVADIDRQLETLRSEGVIPPTVITTLAGSAARLREVQRELLGEWQGLSFQEGSLLVSSLFLALLVVFLLMAALFESFFYPLVIMFSVPLATVGGFAGLAVVHHFVPTQQLDVLTMLGFVILIGIVVNNAILLVHQSLNLLRGEAEVKLGDQVVEQLTPRRAIVEAVRSRVRPIFMSMCTSVGGMLPLVVFPGAGSELYRGLGSVVIGGLIVAAIFTLVLVPLMLSVVFDLRAILFRMMGREEVVEQPAL